MNELAIVLVTAPDKKAARQLARRALEKRLIACANLAPAIESHYWWKGRIESSQEILLVMKTIKKNLSALEKLILRLHPYDTAEFVVLRPKAVTKKYLRWVQDSVQRTD